jgi:hypothetical protein
MKNMENKIGYIYGLVCPIKNEIVYVGQTTYDLKYRLKSHLKETKTRITYDRYLSKKQKWIKDLIDINKENDIKIILLKECYIEELNKNEIYYIAEYKKINELVNTSIGGENTTRGIKMSDEQRERLSNIMKEYYRKNPIPKKPKIPKIKKERKPHIISEEGKKRISEKNSGENNGMYGIHLIKTAEQIEKQRNNMINSLKFQNSRKSEEYRDKISDIFSIPIYLLDLEFNIIMEFKNTKECSEYFGCSRSNVKHAVKDLRKLLKKYWIVRKENYENSIILIKQKLQKN